MRSFRHSGVARLLAGLIGASIAAIALAGCAPSSTLSNPDPRLSGAWHLRAATDARGTLPLDDADITFTIGNSKSSGGRSVCTRYSAQVRGGVGAVFVSTRPVLSDRCQSISDAILDQRYLDDLADTRQATVHDGTLTLASAHGNLVFTRVGTAVTLTGVTWVLDSMSNATSQWLSTSVQGSATLRFSNDGQFILNTTCATLTATYRVQGQKVSVSDYSEDVGNGGICNDKTGAVGAEVVSLVGGAFSFDLKGGQLQMSANSSSTSATFKERGGEQVNVG